MTNRVQFLICVFVLIAGSGLAAGTNDAVVRDSSSKAVKDVVEAKVDPAVYDSLVGRYDCGKHGALRVTRDGSHLFAQFAGRNCEIFPKSETEYFWKVMDAQVTFVKDGRGKVIKAVYHQGGRTIVGSRVVSLELFWLSLYGRWFGAAALLYAFYIGLSVSMTVHWFADFASGIIFGIIVGTTVGRSFAAMDFPSLENGVQNVPQVTSSGNV
jgi:hypothetical protein